MSSWPAKMPVFGVWPIAMNAPVTSTFSMVPPCSRRLDAHAVHAGLVADDFIDGVIPRDAHLAGLLEREQPILQDLLRAELVAPVHHGDVAREVR